MTTINKIYFLLAFLLLFGIIFSILSYYRESEKKLRHTWGVNKLIIDGNQCINVFKMKKISFLPRNLLLLPTHVNYKYKTPISYSEWHFERKDLINGVIIIDDKNQDIFSGEYEIEIQSYEEPWAIRLYNDSIQIYLTRTRKFKLPPRRIDNPLLF